MSRNIVYIMSRFPHLSETFILREMKELEKLGWDISLYPLIVQEQDVIHNDAKPWLSRVHYIPFFSSKVIKENLVTLFQNPGKYLSMFWQSILENWKDAGLLLKTLALFPKAVCIGCELQRKGIDHVHAHYATHPAYVAWVIHQLTGISYSITAHAHDIFVYKLMLETKLKNASFIVAISEYNLDYLAKHVGNWVKEKTHVVHCGITPDIYGVASRVSVRNGVFELISIGSLQSYKGFPFLIDACAILRDNNVPVECRIIGGGEEEDSLLKKIKEQNLQESVFLLGPKTQEEVALLLQSAQCYVQPSIITASGKMEGIPVALMEALACGLPVVSSSLSGIPELVMPDKTGYLVPPANAEALAEALKTVYFSPEKSKRLGVRGRKLVLQEFKLDRNVETLSALLDEVIKPKSTL